MEIVAIVGRPNVGKSSLFNRIVGKSQTIVDSQAGVTRDRIYSEVDIEGSAFILVDTGGFEPSKNERIKNLILSQTEAAISQADKIIALFDGKEGLLPDDDELVKRLRKSNKDVYFAINKIDSKKATKSMSEFHNLGIDNFYKISAVQGTGVSNLIDDIKKQLKETKDFKKKEDGIKLAIVGRPNVGKSSLVNRILNYERVMVDDVPGTTRDAVDTPFEYQSKKYTLIDTAGIRRRSKIDIELEAVSVMAALKAVERADYVLLVVDASLELAHQDKRIAHYALSRGKAMMIIVNKLDLVEDYREIDFDKFESKLKKLYSFLAFCSFIFVSAKLGENINAIMEEAKKLEKNYNLKIETKRLNKLLEDIQKTFKMSYVTGSKGVRAKIKYITQVSTAPPKFLIFCNNPVFIKTNYDKFLKNRLRKEYKFTGSPILLNYRKE